MVVDVGCVVPGDGNTSEQMVEQPRARLGELVQDQAATRAYDQALFDDLLVRARDGVTVAAR